MKKNQKGFSVFEVLLIALLIGISGLIGLYVWNRNRPHTNTNTSNAAKVQKSSPKEYKRSATIPTDWKTYTNSTYKISFRYPSDWVVTTNLLTKKAGEETQNAYSLNATKIFVICLKESDHSQSCAGQININNQPFAQSLSQIRKYATVQQNQQSETELLLDGYRAVEFYSKAQGSSPASRYYFLDANGYTYGLTTVFERGSAGQQGSGSMNATDSLALFESIRVN